MPNLRFEGRAANSSFAAFHPINNFIYFVFVIVSAMFTLHPLFLLTSMFISLLYVTWLKGISGLKYSLEILFAVIAITTAGNMLLSHNGVTVFFYVNNNAITLEALVYGLAMGTMIGTVIVWFSCAQEIIGEEKFIYLFGRISPAVALTISMMFRFIPLLQQRYQMIHQAQTAMGRNHSKNLVKRMRQGGKEISILISWSLENSIETADSMEARGYGLKKRSSFHRYRWERRNWILAILIMTAGIISWIGVFTDITQVYYYPQILFAKLDTQIGIVYLAYIILLITPLIIDQKGERRWKQLQSKM